jgi:proline iminopeptidase
MKKYFSIILLLTILGSYSQKLDSLQYKYGHLYYHSYGKGETIIMLSGGPGNHALQLESVALKLSSTYRVILLEQRGTGLSMPKELDSSTINLKGAINDVNLLMAHLKIKKTILFGHSWGGNLALIYASQFPQKIKSLILLAPGYIGMGWPNYRLFVDNMISKLSNEQKEQLLSLSKKGQSNDTSE